MEVNFEKCRSDCAVSLLKAFQWSVFLYLLFLSSRSTLLNCDEGLRKLHFSDSLASSPSVGFYHGEHGGIRKVREGTSLVSTFFTPPAASDNSYFVPSFFWHSQHQAHCSPSEGPASGGCILGK